MKLTTRVALRHLRSKHSFGFISFSTVLSIIGLTIGIASLIIISCISRGFNDVINFKLSGIDGHLRIRSFLSEEISQFKIQEIDSIIHLLSSDVEFTAPYLEKHAIIRKGALAEGIILYGVPENALDEIFQLNQFSNTNSEFINDDGIIVGKKLAEIMNIYPNDNIIVLNADKMATHQILEAKNLKVVSTFQTDFPEYDRLLAFIPLKTAQSFFGMENQATGLICNVKNPHKIEKTDIILADAVGSFPYMTTTWKERHASLLDWLNIYDVPIKLIMIFITIVGIFNIGASLWMIIIEKTTDFGILQSMGLSRGLITEIILKEGAIIGVLGSIFGIIFSLIVLLLESKYHFIRLPNDIYFMDYLPVHIAPEYFFVYPFIALIITLLFAYLPAKKAANISASEALRYE